MGERDLWVRATTRRAALAFATTPESAERMRRVGARRVEMLSAVALTNDERSCLATLARSKGPEVLFFSAGRLIDWKGYHLSLEAFAAADLPDARYVVAGDGPARDHLEALADRFGLRDRVKFLGAVPRAKVLEWLGRVSVFVHPSLHDSGGWATIEAMAAGVPVICLNLGGPGKQVTEDVGRRLHASSVDATTGALAEAMRELGMDAKLRAELGAGARKRVVEVYTWDTKVAVLSKAYAHAIAEPSPGLG
jgi:glycosyltransferase involved in cell wall biosynthesis